MASPRFGWYSGDAAALTPAPAMLPTKGRAGGSKGEGGGPLGSNPLSTAQHPDARARNPGSSPQQGHAEIPWEKPSPGGPPSAAAPPSRNKGHLQGQTLDCQATPVAQTKRIPLADMPTPGRLKPPGASERRRHRPASRVPSRVAVGRGPEAPPRASLHRPLPRAERRASQRPPSKCCGAD